MPKKEEIIVLIRQNNLKKALEAMAGEYPDAEGLLRSYNAIEREKRLGALSFDEWMRAQNKVAAAALDLLGDKPVAPATPPAQASNLPEQPGSSSKHIPWIVGLVLLVGSAIWLAGFSPCPSPNEERVFNLLMALGGAGMATLLPGLFHFEFKGIKAGSAIGIFVLLYLVKPAGAVKDDSGCNQPFDFTIALSRDKNNNISPQYPDLENATLLLRLDNDWKPATVDANGDAHFRTIPGNFKDSLLAVKLSSDTKYWALAEDLVRLQGKDTQIAIRPDGSLGKIEGKVMSMGAGSALVGATVDVLGVTVQTDANGNFSLDIPTSKQATDYIVDITLDGYEPYRGNASPAGGGQLRALLVNKQKKARK